MPWANEELARQFGEIVELLSPSLFGGNRVVVVRRGQDARKDLVAALEAAANAPGTTLAPAALVIARIEYPKLDFSDTRRELDAIAAAVGVILAALYLLWAYQRVFHGEPDEDSAATPDLTWREGLVMAPLVGLIVFLGVYPQPMLDRIQPSVDRLVDHVEDHSDYEQPEVATEGAGESAEGEHGDTEETEEAAPVVDLMAALRQSVERAEERRERTVDGERTRVQDRERPPGNRDPEHPGQDVGERHCRGGRREHELQTFIRPQRLDAVFQAQVGNRALRLIEPTLALVDHRDDVEGG